MTTVDARVADDRAPAPTPRRGRAWGRVVAGLVAWLVIVALVLEWGERWRLRRPDMKVRAAPFFGRWELEVASTTGLVVAVGLGLAVAAAGTAPWRRLPWRAVLGGAALLAMAWLVALSAVGGPGSLSEPLRDRNEYAAAVPDVEAAGGPQAFARSFTEEIDAYPVHVRGHPPGVVVGLWAAVEVDLDPVLVGTAGAVLGWGAAVAAALAALRATAGEDRARRAAPFTALVPAAVWAGTSFDALFAGVIGTAVALIVLATVRTAGRRSAAALAVAGGALVGVAMLLSYSVVPTLAIPVAVALRSRRVGPLVTAGATAAAVLVVTGLAGFWWPDGLQATREQYVLGVASLRPYSFFVVANIAVLAVSCGPAVAAGLASVGRRVLGPAVLVGGALVAVAAADLSGLSKAEVERIWLPFVPWLVGVAGFLPDDERLARVLLAANAAVAIVVQVLLRTAW